MSSLVETLLLITAGCFFLGVLYLIDRVEHIHHMLKELTRLMKQLD